MTYFYPGDRVVHEVVIESRPTAGTLRALEESGTGETRALVAWDGGDETWCNLRQLRHEEPSP